MMAATMKRKQPAEAVGAKSNKRQKPDSKGKDVQKTQKPRTDAASSKPPASSILAKEQPAFPRGGAGLLTPLEKKQIGARAARDAAAELNKEADLFGVKSGYRGDLEDEDADSQELAQQQQVTKKKSSKRTKAKATLTKDKEIAIEGLSYKRLTVGASILGCVSSINAQDLTISLPNNLTGFVSLTSISTRFREKIEKLLQKEQSEEDDGDEENESGDAFNIDLQSHFRKGQYLRVAVTSLSEESNEKMQPKKKIALSVDPQLVNTGLSSSSLAVGCSVQVVVTSVEDHGLVVDLGLHDDKQGTKGFISIKSLSPNMSLSETQDGSVLLCTVTGLASDGKIVKLSPDLTKSALLKSAPSVEAFLPGTQVEVLISEVSTDGIAGKVMGLLDVTADIVHSGSFQDRESFAEKYKIGQKVTGRLICTFPQSDTKKLGLSLLEHVVRASSGLVSESEVSDMRKSSIVSSAQVVRVAPGLGVYMAIPSGGFGFAHISRLSDKKVDSISETTGAFKVGSEHQARILDVNAVDGLHILSLQKKVISQPYLRVGDVTVGEVVKGAIEKVLVGPSGVQGIILNLAEGVSGLVPQIHMSDIILQHPERKFKEGQVVTARVLSVDQLKRQLRLTLKKTLVNSDQRIWTEFLDVETGDSTVGTLVKVDPHGALVQFYGNVKGFLPVSEMSEAYIKDATEHFRVGQVLTVNALSIKAEEGRLTVSCRDRGASIEDSLASVSPGELVSGTVFEKSQSDVLLRLEGSDVIARLTSDHVSDGSEKKRRSALEKLRVGQKLENILILDVQRAGRLVLLSNRQSLVKAAREGFFLKSWEDLAESTTVTGYVSNITEAGVFVRFANGISGLIAKNQTPVDSEEQANFGLSQFQAVTARVLNIDYRGATPRFWLTMREGATKELKTEQTHVNKATAEMPQVTQPVDDTISSFADFAVGKVTKAKIASVKDTQINVELAKDIQGRIDVSELFDKWEDIKDRKQPLQPFYPKQILTVRILGAHDSRNHRFLPLSHRAGKNTVFELSAKPSTIKSPILQNLSFSDMQIGMPLLAYVNNIVEDCLMVNISPTVRGRIRAIDVSDDLNLAADLEGNFPIGSAMRVQVRSVDVDKSHLDLTGKLSDPSKPLTIENMSPGMILPARVTKVSDRAVIVQLGDDLVGAIDLIDMADDYNQSNTARFSKNDVIRVCVVRIDIPNKKIVLSTRPSKVLSSSMTVLDPEITSIAQLKVNDTVRGFISNVSDKGLFVTLGHGVTAFVRVTNLSDTYLKNWKDSFQRDQLVKGKIISTDEATGHIQMSLKDSVLTGIYKPPLTFTSLKVGDIITGRVVKVEVFGVFILVDNSENVRGLCHRSEMAEQRIEDASKLFSQGDVVKAKVLKLDLPNRRINFGMKASYLSDALEDEDMEDVEEIDDSRATETSSDDGESGGMKIDELKDGADSDSVDIDMASPDEDESDAVSEDGGRVEVASALSQRPTGLSVGGFDWYGMSASDKPGKRSADVDPEEAKTKQKRKKRKSEIQIDRTGDLDTNGPQSTDDFERLLLGEPDSSILWLQYMAFHLELGDIDAARQIGERALRTIGIGQDAEKMNIWIALLNLENAYGDDDSIDVTFKRALEYNDPQEMYGRLTSIYIQSGKHDKADNLFQEMLKKFTQDPKVYINYATFLFDTVKDADKGRAQLTRALQVLPNFSHFELTSKFAQLEFKSASGLPERGRTIFEGLINSFPKRVDLFNILLDLEIKQKDSDAIRALFERVFEKKLKPKQAKYFFKRWLAFEEGEGDERRIEDVKAKAATWVKNQG